MNRIKGDLRTAVYAGLVIAAGGLILGWNLRGIEFSALFLTWFLACLAGEIFWFRTPTGRGTISMALTMNLAAVLILEPATAFAAIGLSTLVAGLYPHRRPAHRALFNAAQSVVAASAAFLVLGLASPAPDRLSIMNEQTTWLALFAAGLAFFAVNTGIVAGVIAFQERQSLFRAWKDNYGYGFELASTLALISLTGFVEMAYRQMGSISILFLLPILAVLWWSSDREARMLGVPEQTGGEEPLRKAG